MSEDRVLSVRDLSVVYSRARQRSIAVQGVSLHVDRGESVALIGESGAGKSTVAKAILGLIRPTSGTIEILGRDMSMVKREEAMRLRGQVQAIMQNPYASLDPRWRIGKIIAEPMWSSRRFAATKPHRDEIRDHVRSLLAEVGLGEEKEGVRPSMLSGGERQRVAIARALAINPAVLVADEPVTALDNTTRSQIIELLRGIAERSATGLFLISHSMSFVAELADRVYVIRGGRILEHGPVKRVLYDPQHEYTKALLEASRLLDFDPAGAAEQSAGEGSETANLAEGAGYGAG